MQRARRGEESLEEQMGAVGARLPESRRGYWSDYNGLLSTDVPPAGSLQVTGSGVRGRIRGTL